MQCLISWKCLKKHYVTSTDLNRETAKFNFARRRNKVYSKEKYKGEFKGRKFTRIACDPVETLTNNSKNNKESRWADFIKEKLHGVWAAYMCMALLQPTNKFLLNFIEGEKLFFLTLFYDHNMPRFQMGITVRFSSHKSIFAGWSNVILPYTSRYDL